MSDFKIQRGKGTIPTSGASLTLTAGPDYQAPSSTSKAWIRICSTSGVTSNGVEAEFGGSPQNNCVSITNPANLLTSVSIQRGASPVATVDFVWEIIEYIGPDGGPNEIVVRSATELALLDATGDTVDSSTISGVVNNADMAVFITGHRNTTGSRGSVEEAATADWITAGPVARLTIGAANGQIDASIAAVEFTGVNWKVQRVAHTYVAADVFETESTSPVVDPDKTFCEFQWRGSAANSGADHMHRCKLVSGSTIEFLTYDLNAGTGESVAWLVENLAEGVKAMKVSRFEKFEPDPGTTATEVFTYFIGGKIDRAGASVTGITTSNSDSNGGSDMGRNGAGYFITEDGENVEITHGIKAQANYYNYEVTVWPDSLAVDATLGPLFIKRPWTKQPPAGTKIDWSNSLTKGLLFAFNGASSPRPLDSVSGEPATGGDPITVNKNGMTGLESDEITTPATWNGTSAAYLNAIRYLDAQQYSHFLIASRHSDSGNNENLGVITHNNNNANQMTQNTNELARQGYNGAGQFNNSPWIWNSLTDSVVRTQAMTFVFDDAIVYGNGIQTGSASPGSNIWNAVTTWNGIGLLGSHNDADVNPDYTLYGYYFWSRVLSASEVKSLNDNPWQIFKPRDIFALSKPDALNQRLVRF